MHIAIAGNIGSGKTTLTTMLARRYGWKPRFESVDYNPYLEDYYKDIKRWSFPMEVFFLKERFKDLLEIRQSKESVVQDRSIYEGVYVFTENNYAMGNLDDRDYETYMELFEDMTDAVRFPDLMIYLRSSVSHLVSNIEKRGRESQQTLRRVHQGQVQRTCPDHRCRQARLSASAEGLRIHYRQDRPGAVRIVLVQNPHLSHRREEKSERRRRPTTSHR